MRAVVGIVLGAILAALGCAQSDLVACPGDLTCPAGTACDPVRTACVDPSQLSACDGAADLTACTTPGIADGACFQQVCRARGCGNGYVEPGELCDDGNTVGGDGCSADCLSKEICGDGYTDRSIGETCDDGNHVGRDGCSADCSLEDRVWRPHLQVPPPRSQPGVATDFARGRIVMFGGAGSDADATLADTWEWDGTGWTDASLLVGSTRPSPPDRVGHGMTYDQAHHVTVMFGGLSELNFTFFADTWTWDGTNWLRAAPAHVPPARESVQLAWDGTGVLAFGGNDGFDILGDTWRWDGSDWTALATGSAATPGPRDDYAMAYDPANRRVVLFGGADAAGDQLTDTWTWDGSAWAPLQTTGPLPPNSGYVFGYDLARGVLVLDGGTTRFELAGATWTDTTPKSSGELPTTTGGFQLGYDRTRDQLLHIAGDDSDGPSSEVYAIGSAGYDLVAAPAIPPSRSDAAIAMDPIRARVVVFGGVSSSLFGNTTLLGDTWEWDGRGWQRSVPNGAPAARRDPAATYDGVSQRMVMFGGTLAASVITDEMWAWDGAAWTAIAKGSPWPGPRTGAAMTYDGARHRVVMVGGSDGVQASAETWAWDGAAWQLLAPATSPPARSASALAYDGHTQRSLLFGGHDSDGVRLADTWEWDGETWTARATGSADLSPEPRGGHALVYDRARERVALFGGDIVEFAPWEWDGSAWTPEVPLRQPPLVVAPAAVYDVARREIVMFGGNVLLGTFDETWAGSYLGSPEESCDAGIDLDGDGAAGCADDDCALVCQPTCTGDAANDIATCGATGPRCGDGSCDGTETDRDCAADCVAGSDRECGDGYCAKGESCPADCP